MDQFQKSMFVSDSLSSDNSAFLWDGRLYPDNGCSILSNGETVVGSHFKGSPVSRRFDVGSFINSMADPSFAYFSLVREYAGRSLQGKALQYEGLYKSMVSENTDDEALSLCSVRVTGQRLTVEDF